MDKKKVLILHGQPGMGHLMAAQALVEAFSKKYPKIEVKSADGFDFLHMVLSRGYPYLYNKVVANAPILFKIFYNSYYNKSVQKFLERITLFFIKKEKFISFVKDFSPDFIIATNPLPLQLVALIEEKHIIDIVSANVCTDFGFHRLWHNKDINYYFVANKEMQKSIVRHNVSLDRIKITGIPVRLRFNQVLNRQEIIQSLNFNDSNPILLIVGGQLNYRDLLKVITGIKKRNNLVQFIVVAGRDRALCNKLENSKLKKDCFVRVFGMVNDIERFMTISDLILSKAGGSTVSECLVKSLPMILYRPIPGQEEDNVNYLIKNKAGVKAKNTKEIINVVADLFSNKKKLTKMKESCKKIQKPKSAEDIVDFVVSQI